LLYAVNEAAQPVEANEIEGKCHEER
jgi:hypothetical protein